MTLIIEKPQIKDFTFSNISSPKEVGSFHGNKKIYLLKDNTSELCNIEFVYDGGYASNLKSILPSAVNGLLLSATSDKNAEEIADIFDAYGAYTSPNLDDSFSGVSLYALHKYIKEVLSLYVEFINDQVFDAEELELFKLNKLQQLKISREKTSYLSKKSFYKNLFGDEHYLGTFTDDDDIRNLTVENCSQYFKENYGLKYVVLTGGFSDEDIEFVSKKLNEHFDSVIKNKQLNYPIKSSAVLYEEIPKNDAVQCSYRAGFLSIPFYHPDYIKLNIVNNLFGGFFGSRLMKNIREDKGYTYGIHSSLQSFSDFSFLSVSSDVKKSSYKEITNEISKEILRLSNEDVAEEELQMLKSYLAGNLLHRFETNYGIASLFISLKEKNADLDYYVKYFDTLKSITPEDIKEITKKYLTQPLYVSIAGV